jgi:hypothetical protein
MPLATNAYGAVSDVAALTSRFTNNGIYDASTRPTISQVETWINRVSSTLNILLAEQGFQIPITQADCVLTLALFVSTQVADLCNYANSAGRFFQNQNYTVGPWQTIQKEAAAFIAEHAAGFEALGAPRATLGLNGLDARTLDDAGDDIEPWFARKQFGNTVTDWDSTNGGLGH